MILITAILLWIFGSFHVSSQCFNSNANCDIIYHDGKCMYYTGSGYAELSEVPLSTYTMMNKCGAYWTEQHGNWTAKNLCNDKNSLIWPVGSCGCPRCECEQNVLCCYESVKPFDINNWNDNAQQIQCDPDTKQIPQDMCLYSIDATGDTNVSCSNKDFLFNYLTINVSLPKSTILDENNNTACYTFVESVNGTNTTTLQCFCGDNGCNNLADLNILAPELKAKNGCYVSDTFHTEEFWADYVYEDISCEMCSVSLYESNNGLKSDMKCSSRSQCYTLLNEYDAYNDELFGCVTISNTTTNESIQINIQCCCDPSLHGNLCNKNFFKSEAQNAIIFGCWKADFVDITNSEWQNTAKRINCSTELDQYCVIQSFGGNKFSSNCESEANCNNTKNAKRICCNGINDDFCNEPSIFDGKSSAYSRFCPLFCFKFLILYFYVMLF